MADDTARCTRYNGCFRQLVIAHSTKLYFRFVLTFIVLFIIRIDVRIIHTSV